MRLTILGAGVAGLATGHYARQRGLPFSIFEAAARVGGNAATLRHGEFLFDTGAHRLHDRFSQVTEEVKRLLGDNLHRVAAPSQIYSGGRFVNFPLTPFNLLKTLGPRRVVRAAREVIASRVGHPSVGPDLESTARAAYGATLAELFLLTYSEKLWGIPSRDLSNDAAGRRMKGLAVSTFIQEALFGQRAGIRHLDGAFYYPTFGIGMIADRLAASCGERQIRLGARITRLLHAKSRIVALEVNGAEQVAVDDAVVNTLPLPLFVHLLSPPPPAPILHLAERLRFRDVRLVAILLNKESVTGNATVYFPERTFIFTRVSEPRNRSQAMAPAGCTSLVAEIPCWRNDDISSLTDQELIRRSLEPLESIGWFRRGEVFDAVATRLNAAYPVLEVGYAQTLTHIRAYLATFRNLHLIGRPGAFMYTHVHDQMNAAHDLVDALCGCAA